VKNLEERIRGLIRKLEKDSEYLQYDKGYNHAIDDVLYAIKEIKGVA